MGANTVILSDPDQSTMEAYATANGTTVADYAALMIANKAKGVRNGLSRARWDDLTGAQREAALTAGEAA